MATAHKIARIVYHLLKYHVQYADIGADGFAQKQREREVASLQKKRLHWASIFFPPNPFQWQRESRQFLRKSESC